jgi:hypothetical protein
MLAVVLHDPVHLLLVAPDFPKRFEAQTPEQEVDFEDPDP